MEMNELFNYILEKGCGSKLEDGLKSVRYKELLEMQNTLFDRYSPDSDEGIILRTGNIESTNLLNSYSESEALSLAVTKKSNFGHGLQDRAIINYIGEEILRAAKEQLPAEAYSLAKRWIISDADEQIAITKEIYELFKHENQCIKEDLHMDNLSSVVLRDRENNIKASSKDSFLPYAYGVWDRKDNPANCQGKTQMIVAFAEMAGADILLMNPNSLARDVIDDLKVKSCERVIQDIIQRNMSFPDSGYMDSLKAAQLRDEFKTKEDAFHLCPVIRVRDGRWVIIDSNSLNWGVLGENWEMDKIYTMLKKYEEVVPGLVLYSGDSNLKEKVIDSIWNQFDNLLMHSLAVEKLIGPINDVTECIRTLAGSDELDFLLSMTPEFDNYPKSDQSVREVIAMIYLIGDSDTFMHDFLKDPENYLQKKKESLYTYYHCLATNMIGDSWNENGSLVHPESSFFSNYAYHIAISAINSAGIDCRVSSTIAFLSEYSCCQTTMYNAIFSQHSSPELSEAAMKNLLIMPSMHKLTRKILKIKNYYGTF